MRSTWLERLQDRFYGKDWSNGYRQARLKHHLDEGLRRATFSVPTPHRLMALEEGIRQLAQLESTVGLRPVFSTSPARWAYFERLQSAPIGDIRLFTAPDLTVYHQGKWTLIRLQFRSASSPSEARQIEHLLMVHWAMAQPGFPDDATAFRVKVIRWRAHRWVEHHVTVTPELLDQAASLVAHDVAEMKWLLRSANADPSLESLALAADERTCQICSVRETCPAQDGLQRAKEAQRLKLELPIHRAETRS